MLWLWHRPAAEAPIRPRSLGTSIGLGCSPEKTKRQKKKEEEEEDIMLIQRNLSVATAIALNSHQQGVWSSRLGEDDAK